ncbi:hypothetical protein Vretimale_7975 [Volvox reticuliferus]|uniref:Sm domain-containing protein n=1 Tax=Volvox reticuliferus TaxID=1737510 RepID=A0A8J4C8G6_9CHLO|nr:hypothetical protein Vretifemale_5087 [Volvox reticuliferus]GIM03148.1 hypothetical protein Vretimale_7975 [Volvox reticuliferus]
MDIDPSETFQQPATAHPSLQLPPPPPPLPPPPPRNAEASPHNAVTAVRSATHPPSHPDSAEEGEVSQAPDVALLEAAAAITTEVAAAGSAPPSPSLDFLSPAFDSLRALHTPGLQPPLPDVRPLDNVSQCRKLLPPEVPDALPLEKKAKVNNEESRKKHLRFKESAVRLRERIRNGTTYSLDRVLVAAAVASPGPLDVLRRWHAAAARVSVTTRHATGVRGRATGVLTAYDRFMNLVLRDVNECYTVPVRRVKEYTRLVPASAVAAAGSGGGGGSSDAVLNATGSASVPPPSLMVEVTRIRIVRRREVRQRRLGQVFIKGDNVVVVHLAPLEVGEGGAADAATMPESVVDSTAAATAVSQERPVPMQPRNLMASDAGAPAVRLTGTAFRTGLGCTGGSLADGWGPCVPAYMPAPPVLGGGPGGLRCSLAPASWGQQPGDRSADSAAYQPTGYQRPATATAASWAARGAGVRAGHDAQPWG